MKKLMLSAALVIVTSGTGYSQSAIPQGEETFEARVTAEEIFTETQTTTTNAASTTGTTVSAGTVSAGATVGAGLSTVLGGLLTIVVTAAAVGTVSSTSDTR